MKKRKARIEFQKVSITGVNNPLLQMRGTFKQNDMKLEFVVKGKKVSPT